MLVQSVTTDLHIGIKGVIRHFSRFFPGQNGVRSGILISNGAHTPTYRRASRNAAVKAVPLLSSAT